MPSLRAKALASLIIAPGLFCGIHHPLVPKIPRSLWSRGVLCELELVAAILSAILSHLWKGTQHQLDPVIHRIKIRRLLYKDLNTEYIVFLLPCLASSFLLDPGAFPSLL